MKALARDSIKMYISKTDFINYLYCRKNAWLRKHKPEVATEKLSEFEEGTIEMGNEVEAYAREMFPAGILVKGRDLVGQTFTKDLIRLEKTVIFQPVFLEDVFLVAADILERVDDNAASANGFDEPKKFNLYEVKATSEVNESHLDDLAFQKSVIERAGLIIDKTFVVHLNRHYIKKGELSLRDKFVAADVTEEVCARMSGIKEKMEEAKKYLLSEEEPLGACDCIHKGRSNHCESFSYSNPEVPEYAVHDLAYIGRSKRKLQELIGLGIYKMEEVPDDFDLDLKQMNQVMTHKYDKILIDKALIKKELDDLIYPLYFLDYETFAPPIPMYDGYKPFQRVPFQFSLHILEKGASESRHFGFLHKENSDPGPEFCETLKSLIGTEGNVVVWNKSFECSVNRELGDRMPEFKGLMEAVNGRVFDLMEVFKKQYYVHKDFKGSFSIKYVLPVLVPDFSYAGLNIKEGGMASEKWRQMVLEDLTKEEKRQIAEDLTEYCKLDTYAMQKIFETLKKLCEGGLLG